ncbi:hypothetical protein J6590_009390 [Homalodisca vitripennis]|nr:hypothetical protein J6590_009390 [Homalodisca vitripennis]
MPSSEKVKLINYRCYRYCVVQLRPCAVWCALEASHASSQNPRVVVSDDPCVGPIRSTSVSPVSRHALSFPQGKFDATTSTL